MKKKKMIIIVLVLAAVIGAIAIRYTWVRIWRMELTSDGLPVTQARVYRNWSGDLMVDLRPASGDLYVVRKSSNAVGIPNASSVIESPAVVLAKESPLGIVDLRTDKGGGVDPKLLLTSERLSFVAANGKKIQVSWR